MTPFTVLAIPGSLRAASYNRALLRAAAELAPPSVEVTVFEDLGSVPLFDEDAESDLSTSSGVVALRRAVARSDGMLVATPEYNRSVPGVVKNMVDWLSRSSPGEGLRGKPVAVTGVTPGPWGTRIAQTTLRQMLLSVEACVMPSPALFVADASDLFDEEQRLCDPQTRLRLEELVASFGQWISRFSTPTGPEPDDPRGDEAPG